MFLVREADDQPGHVREADDKPGHAREADDLATGVGQRSS
jgi:hypothetical protein